MERTAGRLVCYSRLGNILSDREMTVAEFHRGLARRGVRVNLKTLYRLADPTAPIERLDMTVAAEICKALEVSLSDVVTFEAGRRDVGLRKLPAAQQRRLDALLERNAETGLSRQERKELSHLVKEAERLTLRNARMLARARRTMNRV